MEKINLLKAKEKNKNYISINSYSNNQEDIIYLRFVKENLENITNNDVPKIITNKEKMLEKLNIIFKKNKIKNGENKKIMYFYKTFQKSGDCSYVPFMKIENKEVDGSFKSFFGLLKLAKKGKYNFKDVKLPSYLDKNGFTTLVIGFIRIKDDTLTIPYSYLFASEHKRISIKIPTILKDKKIKEIRIIPKLKARYFEIQYVYESKIEKLNLNKENALGIDLGIDNLCTCVTNNGKDFIIDGRKLKSINQFYNKRNASLQSLKDTKKKIKEKIKLLQAKITTKRNNRVNDYLSKTARTIINYCIENDIGKIVIGYNVTFQRNSNIGKVNNQNFVNIPYGKLRNKLEYLCDMYGIEYILQEESYTSKASFFDRDDLPVYNADNPQEYIFSGRRVKRGLYMTKKGNLINADVNGALNILRKSNVVDLTVLCDRGGLDTPKRIRII